METTSPTRTVLVPFVCPVCAAENAVELLVLSRAGGTDCVGCKRRLRSADVMRAMHAPRAPMGQARLARPVVRTEAMVWPPTPESRAAIAPMRRRRDGSMN